MAQAATITNIAADLASGRVTSRMLVDAALRKIAADGRAYGKVYDKAARAAADAADTRRRQGQPGSMLSGIPVTIKDNMDVEGEVTLAGSKVLKDGPPASADAEVVQRLKVAGAIIIAKTFMPELALSGIGTSSHASAPPNPLDGQRVPGGSSSGAAVSVAKGVVPAAIGTDTGGSVTLPASVSGLVGYKPTAALVPLAGILPLSRHLDSVGAIGRSVSCCRAVVQVLAQDPRGSAERSLRGLRLAVPQNYVLDDLDPHIATAFADALADLSAAGAVIVDVEMPQFDRIPDVYTDGGFSMPEIHAWLSERGLLAREADFDPRALARIMSGASTRAVDMLLKLSLRQRLAASAGHRLRQWDGLLIPATPIPAPRFADVAADDDYARLNMLLMRNTRVVNVLDACALSLPLKPQTPGEAVGLMLMAGTGRDRDLLGIGEAIEKRLRRDRHELPSENEEREDINA